MHYTYINRHSSFAKNHNILNTSTIKEDIIKRNQWTLPNW